MTRSERPWDVDPSRTITVVSGLPRSGTSMMMQMLEVAGLELATDPIRVADSQNPNGYFELEAVKRLPKDPSFLALVVGKAVKIVSPLLSYLPPEYNYRVIVMERDSGEVMSSQRAMLDPLGGDETSAPDERILAEAFHCEREKAKVWLAEQANIRSCHVSYQQALDSPAEIGETIFRFLSETGAFGKRGADAEFQTRVQRRIAAVVDPALYRQRNRR